MSTMAQSNRQPTRSSWREPYFWLVIAAPLTAVIAGITTVVIAYRGADELVKEPVIAVEQVAPALKPAISARNAAAADALNEAPKPQR